MRFFKKNKQQQELSIPENDSPTEQARALAHELYSKRTCCCSEAVLVAINEVFHGGLATDHAIRLGSALCGGIGGSGNTCGALNASIMAAGLLLGRSTPEEKRSKAGENAAREIFVTFEKEFGHTICRDLTRDVPRTKRSAYCGDITSRSAALIADVLQKYQK